MYIMLGPPGAGKSLQGQILAARYGWNWVSVGRLLREQADPKILAEMHKGKLLPADETIKMTLNYLESQSSLDNIILDGFPRMLEQAEALDEYLLARTGGHGINAIIALDLGRTEILERLLARGRIDDNEEAINGRIELYAKLGEPILDFYANLGVRIERIIASRTVGQVHDDIDAALRTSGAI